MTLALCFTLFMFVMGIMNLFFRDSVWELQVFSNEMRGQASERTELWDIATAISGAFFIIVSIVVFCWATSGSHA